MPSFPKDSLPKRRTWRRWPPEAFAIVRQHKPPVALCEELATLTGNDKRACWSFLSRQGISRPGSATRHRFTRQECDALVEYISDHGIQAAAIRFGYEAKSLYNLLYRLEHTRMSRDTMSLRELSMHLRVGYSRVRGWVEKGLLKAIRRESKSGSVSYLVEFDDLQRFCREHRDLLITRRSCPHRIRFLEEYVFAPKHAELLRTRESKREAEAFGRGEFLRGSDRNLKSA